MQAALEYKPNFPEAVERMKRFWDLEEPGDRVPAAIYLPEPEGRKADGSFYGRLGDYVAHMEEYFRLRADVPDEYFPTVVPQYGHTMISVLLGCEVRHAAETLWSIPCMTGEVPEADLSLDWGNEWGARFREDYERLLETARGRYAVGQYEIEGVSDTYSAVRSAERMFYDFADEPEKAHRFTSRIVDALVSFGRWNQRNVSDRQDLMGGMTSVYPIWMPRDSCVTTEDHSVMFSREYYSETIRRHAERLTSSFACTLMEVHGEGNHQIRSFAGMAGVGLLTLGNPLGMGAEHRADVQSLLGRKRLRFGVEENKIEEVLEFTGIRGVLLCFAADSVASANRILGRLEKATQRLKRST